MLWGFLKTVKGITVHQGGWRSSWLSFQANIGRMVNSSAVWRSRWRAELVVSNGSKELEKMGEMLVQQWDEGVLKTQKWLPWIVLIGWTIIMPQRVLRVMKELSHSILIPLVPSQRPSTWWAVWYFGFPFLCSVVYLCLSLFVYSMSLWILFVFSLGLLS